MNYEILLSSIFLAFGSANKHLIFEKNIYTIKLDNISLIHIFFRISLNLCLGQNRLFSGLAVLGLLVIIVKGVCLRLLSLLALV